jgi:hypothetical protein
MKKLIFIILLIVPLYASAWQTVGNNIACDTKNNLSKAVRALINKDRSTLYPLIKYGNCIMLEHGIPVHVKEMTLSKVKISYMGVQIWTIQEAVINK